MDRIWANRLIEGETTFDFVPTSRKESVKRVLQQDVIDEKITKERYEEIVGEPFPEQTEEEQFRLIK